MDPQNPTSFSYQFAMGPKRSSAGSIVFGVVFVALGVALLLDTARVIDLDVWGTFRTWWPSILAVWALARVATRNGSFLGNTILFAVGVLLQLSSLDIIDGFWSAFWPILFILAGLSLLRSNLRRARKTDTQATAGRGDGMPYERDYLESNALMAGASTRVTSKSFKGGSISSIMGGLEIDLRSAEIDGNLAVLEATCVMGGIEIRVPPHWTVQVNGTPILGGIEDETNKYRDDNVVGPTLILDATVVLGGIEIKT
jgi:predicted membrane protein